ncbi:TPA: hypothetical protein DDZ86_04730 [Candidatus Dependentiae bacterium]|nr:hypothetical protein [Candidatus Dependentiae bacterium]
MFFTQNTVTLYFGLVYEQRIFYKKFFAQKNYPHAKNYPLNYIKRKKTGPGRCPGRSKGKALEQNTALVIYRRKIH